jgi:hypothetical protein
LPPPNLLSPYDISQVKLLVVSNINAGSELRHFVVRKGSRNLIWFAFLLS